MKKIPTLFERKFEGHKVVEVLPNVAADMEWVLNDEGVATVKWDGACCAIINGEFYKRYDAKHGKEVPSGSILCEEKPDSVTGHFPCWVKCDRDNPADKWFWAAYDNLEEPKKLEDGTYEAVGEHFQSNPYGYKGDALIPHGKNIIEVDRSFEGIRDYLKKHEIEGIVFWKDGEPRCKIKRKDFGFPWGKELRRTKEDCGR